MTASQADQDHAMVGRLERIAGPGVQGDMRSKPIFVSSALASEFARRYVEGFRLNTWIADRDPRYRITSPSPNVVRISDGDITHQLDITVDAASSLPVKISAITLSDPAHPIPSDELTTEWETVQGIRFPRRWTVFRSGVRVAEAKDARSVVNSGLKLTDLAAEPRDLKPVLFFPR